MTIESNLSAGSTLALKEASWNLYSELITATFWRVTSAGMAGRRSRRCTSTQSWASARQRHDRFDAKGGVVERLVQRVAGWCCTA